MSEEEIIEKINWAIHVNEMTKSINGDNTHISVNVLQGLLDLYNKEKEKNKELLEEIENWKFTKKYVEDNYIARAEIVKLLNNETINISGFECIAKSDLETILEK